MTRYTTNSHGFRFYIEPAMDFADDVGMVEGRGVYAGLVQGNDEIGGVWFSDEFSARRAISEYRG